MPAHIQRLVHDELLHQPVHHAQDQVVQFHAHGGRASSLPSTSFWGFIWGKGKQPPKLPPIHCGEPADEREEMLDELRLRAQGEKAAGRKDGPATKMLKEELALEEGKRHKKHKEIKHSTSGMKKKVLFKSPYKIKRLWQEQGPGTHDEKPEKEEEETLTPSRALGRAPKFPNRSELINEGPFPLRSRMAQLAAHVYYLWGEAKFLDYLAEGTNVQYPALNVQVLAKAANDAARRMVEDAHIPVSRSAPNLPVEVSTMPLSPCAMVGALRILQESRSVSTLNADAKQEPARPGAGFL
eukprot:TRINITY_DN19965_c0_g1_i1.p1 TRINITY_DN19965_c0_g1~~TRINITY_DN19965_c0_g1_i1.p1  ORF type:complete len:297 (-),score=48.16 TRINITY_DN19965_c0_g1_i1:9-899(-)